MVAPTFGCPTATIAGDPEVLDRPFLVKGRFEQTQSELSEIEKKQESAPPIEDTIDTVRVALPPRTSVIKEDQMPPPSFSWQVCAQQGSVQTESALRLVRATFLEQILRGLKSIQQHCGTPSAAMHARIVMRAMRDFDSASLLDPILEVVMALHDAMAFQNAWLSFSSAQYEEAARILKFASQEKRLSDKKVYGAIGLLEEAGFDTTPFGSEIEAE